MCCEKVKKIKGNFEGNGFAMMDIPYMSRDGHGIAKNTNWEKKNACYIDITFDILSQYLNHHEFAR